MITWQRTHLASCASTNDEALALAKAGAPDGTVVTTDAQTAGRGRAGRTWISPPGANVYLSLVLRTEASPAITLAAGIGACDAIRAAGVAHARLKWPNDVLAGDRKLAGILAERHGNILILGIGVDVDAHPPDLPATCLRAEGATISRDDFTELLLAHLAPWLERFADGGVAAIARAWEVRADLARRVRTGTQDGTPIGLADDGALLIALDGGGEARVIAGDVIEV